MLVSFCQGCSSHYGFTTALSKAFGLSLWVVVWGAFPFFLTLGISQLYPANLPRMTVIRLCIFMLLVFLEAALYFNFSKADHL
jgi:hypothetical protein